MPSPDGEPHHRFTAAREKSVFSPLISLHQFQPSKPFGSMEASRQRGIPTEKCAVGVIAPIKVEAPACAAFGFDIRKRHQRNAHLRRPDFLGFIPPHGAYKAAAPGKIL